MLGRKEIVPSLLKMTNVKSWILLSLINPWVFWSTLFLSWTLISPVMEASWQSPGSKPHLQKDINILAKMLRDARREWSQQMETCRLRKWTSAWVSVSFPWFQIYSKINATYHERLMAFQKPKQVHDWNICEYVYMYSIIR